MLESLLEEVTGAFELAGVVQEDGESIGSIEHLPIFRAQDSSAPVVGLLLKLKSSLMVTELVHGVCESPSRGEGVMVIGPKLRLRRR